MKKLLYFTLILIIFASIWMFGAWSPVTQIETETRYADAPIISSVATETVYFTSRDNVEMHDTDGGAPVFIGAGLSNACGAVAGAEIVAYYDKYYPNLIPGWDSYYPATGKYRSQSTTYVDPMMKELYTLMQTNVGGDGVTEANFKSGLQTYFTNHGYSASYTSVKSGSSLNYSACKTAIDSNKVIVLFTTPGNVYDIVQTSDHDTIGSFTISGNHIMIAYGYLQIKYYSGTTLFRTDTYLKVATGRSAPDIAFYKLGTNNIEAACIVNVG